MDNISARMGYPVYATEATAVWDSLATGPYRDKAMIVYPQASAPPLASFLYLHLAALLLQSPCAVTIRPAASAERSSRRFM